MKEPNPPKDEPYVDASEKLIEYKIYAYEIQNYITHLLERIEAAEEVIMKGYDAPQELWEEYYQKWQELKKEQQ